MEKDIKSRFTEKVRNACFQRYKLDGKSCNPLDGFESYIFDCGVTNLSADSEIILRIGHDGRRNSNLVKGEIDFINYLYENGVSVASGVESPQGNMVETVDDGQNQNFVMVAFVKIHGFHPWDSGWTDDRYLRYGQLIGRMHALAKTYQPANPEWKRPEWDDPIMHELDGNLGSDHQFAIDKYQECMDRAAAFSKDKDAYGLVHFDAHSGNMLMDDNGDLTVFDFDDSHYTWFANDLAMCLFYMQLDPQDPTGSAAHFMTCFLKGYNMENKLDPQWLETIPMFLKMRQIDLFAILHRSYDVNNLDPTDPNEKWCIDFLKRNEPRIRDDLPVIDYDFRKLEQLLS